MSHSQSHLDHHVTQLVPHDDYKLVKVIGTGTFGAVFLVKDSKGQFLAIKKTFLDPRYKSRELSLLLMCDHPNVLRLINNYITNEGSRRLQYLHLVTDYLPDTLYTFHQVCPNASIQLIKIFCLQLFEGLGYLHSIGICHRDIKPSNVLINIETKGLQICDFGSAKMLKDNEESVSYIATRSYRAPELILDCPFYSTAIDIWAAGCVIAEFYLKGNVLFTGTDNNRVFRNIMKIIGRPNPTDFNSFQHSKPFHPLAQDVVLVPLEKVLAKNAPPEFIDFLKFIFVYDPSKRPTAQDCIQHSFFKDVDQTQLRKN